MIKLGAHLTFVWKSLPPAAKRCWQQGAAMALVGIGTALVLVCAACDESLPPYVAPSEILVYGMTMEKGDVTVDTSSVNSGGSLSISATSVYDEALSDKARVSGTFTARLKNRPDSSRTFTCSDRDLVRPSMLEGSTLTILPGQTLVLTHAWDHRTDGGTPLWESLAFTREVTSKGIVYYRSETATMQIQGTVQLFDKVQSAQFPLQEFPIVYVLFDTPVPIPPP